MAGRPQEANPKQAAAEPAPVLIPPVEVDPQGPDTGSGGRAAADMTGLGTVGRSPLCGLHNNTAAPQIHVSSSDTQAAK